MSDLLPPNATPKERALAEAVARLSDVPVRVRDVWNVDTIPLALLPWLAWAYSVDEWDSGWLESQKRATVKSALQVQKIKGTIGAVKTALAALGLDIEVQEWFSQTPAGDPYTFRVHVRTEQTPADQDSLRKALTLIETTKSLRSHLETVLISAKSEAPAYPATVAHIGHDITVSNFVTFVMIVSETAIILEQ